MQTFILNNRIIKSTIPIEMYIGSGIFFLLILSILSFLLFLPKYELYSKSILKGDSYIKVYNFTEAYNTYAGIRTFLPGQDAEIAARIATVQQESTNYKNYVEGLNELNIQNYSKAKQLFTKIQRNSELFLEAHSQINYIHALAQEPAIAISITHLLTEGDKAATTGDLAKAKLLLSQAQIQASAAPTINNKSELLDSIATKMALVNNSLSAKQLLNSNANKNIFSFHVPILMYHYIRINPVETDRIGFSLSVTPIDFATQMNYLAANAYTTVTVDDVVNSLKNKQKLPDKSVVITFDDGYDNFFTTAYPILKQNNQKAETFIITNFIDRIHYMTWDMLAILSKDPLITIGSHTLDHVDLKNLSFEKAQTEITTSKAILESKLQITVRDFCYPSGSFNAITPNIVENAGYMDAVTTADSATHVSGNYYVMQRTRVSGGENLQTFISRL